MKNEIRLITIYGIEIGLSWSWFFIFFLISFLLIFGIFPTQFPQFTLQTNIAVGLVTSVLFFVSLIAHELMHSIVAKKNGLDVKKITLFIFGGVSQLSDEPDTPGLEFKMAAAGPATSLFLALVFFLLTLGLTRINASAIFWAPFQWLAYINFVLAIFNLLPGFPLDGGRVLRAILWGAFKDVKRATRIASITGRGFASILILLGLLSFVSGQPGGLWFILIGWFLYQAAVSSYEQLLAKESLKGVIVSQVMTTNVVTVPPDLSLKGLMDDYILRYGFKRVPVSQGRELLGMVGLTDLHKIPSETWDIIKVSKILRPIDPEMTTMPGEDAMKALAKMGEHDLGQLIVVGDTNRLVGVVSRRDILKQIQTRRELMDLMGRE